MFQKRFFIPLVALSATFAFAQSAQLPTGPRLKDLVNRPDTQILYVGGVLNDYPTNYAGFADAANYEFVAGREFNLLSGENSMKWMNFQHNQGEFQYSIPNSDTLFAEDNNSQFHGHMLVGGHRNYIPDWVFSLTSSTDVLNAMYDEIDAQAGYYRTSLGHSPVQVWQVVNEAMDPHDSPPVNSDWTQGLRNSETLTRTTTSTCQSPPQTTTGNNMQYDIFVKTIGASYIEKAFRRAHSDSPSALLIYNDTGDGEQQVQDGGSAVRREYIYEMVSDFVNPNRSGGAVPISGVGFQAHGFGSDTDTARQSFQRFSDLGVGIYITEMDDDVWGVSDPTANNDLLDKQARRYHNYLDAIIRVPGLRSIQFWGINDAHTFRNGEHNSSCMKNAMPEPLLFDVDSNPKPAYYAVQDALATQYRLEAVSNNDLESGSLSPWVARNGGALAISTSTTHSGTYSVKIGERTVPNSGPSQDVTSQITSQGAGRYFLRGWMKVPSGSTTAKLTLRIEDATGVNFYSTPESTVTTSWTQISGWVPVKWNKTLTSVILYAETTGTGAPDFFLDDVTLSDGTLLANGRFENGINGWTVNYGGSLAATSSSTDDSAGTPTFFYGSGGVQVTERSQPYHGVAQDVTAKLLAAGPGTFSLSGMMKLFPGASSLTGELRLRLNDNGTIRYYSVTAPVGSDKWYRINGTVDISWTMLNNATFYVDTTSGTSSYYADDLIVRIPFITN